MHSLAHTVPSRLVIPFGVWFSFNFGNTLVNLYYSYLVLIPILVAILLAASH